MFQVEVFGNQVNKSKSFESLVEAQAAANQWLMWFAGREFEIASIQQTRKGNPCHWRLRKPISRRESALATIEIAWVKPAAVEAEPAKSDADLPL